MYTKYVYKICIQNINTKYLCLLYKYINTLNQD